MKLIEWEMVETKNKPWEAPKVHLLFETGDEITVDSPWGPGYWYRIIEAAKKHLKIQPEDFGWNIANLYYQYALGTDSPEYQDKWEQLKYLLV